MSSTANAHRFFCSNLAETGLATLVEAEAHHAMHVLRSQPNDIVELFNGAGLVATCRISVIRKRDIELEVIASRHDAPTRFDLTLATAVPKGDRFEWLVEKATELGVSSMIPLVTSRSVVDPRASKLDKLRQTVIASCKQSGRNHLMTISPVTSWSEFLKGIVATRRVCVAHPGSNSIDSRSIQERPVTVVIGPEGGFTNDEIQSALAAGAETFSLGPTILRIETAGIASAAKILL